MSLMKEQKSLLLLNLSPRLQLFYSARQTGKLSESILLQAVAVFRESTRLSAELRAEVTAISHGTQKTRENG